MRYLFNTGAKHGFPSYHTLFTGIGVYTFTKDKVLTNASMGLMGLQRVVSKNHTIIDVALTIGAFNLLLLIIPSKD